MPHRSPAPRPFGALVLIKCGVLDSGGLRVALAVGLADLVFAGVAHTSSPDSCIVLGGAGSSGTGEWPRGPRVRCSAAVLPEGWRAFRWGVTGAGKGFVAGVTALR